MGFEITLETTTSGGEYVRIKRDDYIVHIDRHEVSIKRIPDQVDQSEDQFIIYGNGNNLVGHILRWSEVDIPVSVDEDDLFDKLTEICISNSSITGTVDVNIASPLPLPVDIVSPLPLPVDIVSPLPLPVDIVSPLPLPVDIVSPLPLPVDIVSPLPLPVDIVSPLPVPVDIISPLPIPISGSVTATISGIVYVVEPGCLTQRYPSLDEVPILVYMGAVSLVSFITINPNGSSKFLKIFDTVAAPIIGTTPAKLVFPITSNFLNSIIDLPRPVKFVNGIWIAATNGHTDTSTNFTGTTLDSTIFYEL